MSRFLSVPGRFFRFVSLVILGLFLFSTSVKAQNFTEKEFEQALRFMRDSLYSNTYHHAISPIWLKNNKGFVYRNQTRDGTVYTLVSYAGNKKQQAFDHEKIKNLLESVSSRKIDSKNLPLRRMIWENENEFTFHFEDKKYKINRKNDTISEVENIDNQEDESVSPKQKHRVRIKDGNLFLTPSDSENEIALTTDGDDYYIYGSYYGWDQTMAGENTPPKPNLTVHWSPDESMFLTQIMDARTAEKMYLLDWSVDSLYKPKLLSYYRGSPADTNVVTYTPIIFDVKTKKMIKTDFKQPHFLSLNLNWSKNGKILYGLHYHRGYKKMDIVEIDAGTGKSTVIFSDSSDTNIEYKTQFQKAENEGIAFLTSEKTGWNQLYKIDWKTGKSEILVPGNYVVKDILGIDEKNKTLYFTASGKEENVNPYYEFLYKVNFNGKGFQLLTPEPMDHQVVLSPDFNYFIDNKSTPNVPTVSSLRSTKNGKIILSAEETDISDLTAQGWNPPQLFSATARDGKTTIYGALWKPTHFDKNKKYPIIDYTYTGPHTQIVPTNFQGVLWPYAYADIQSLAELGFVVMQIDGLGSAGRSKEFRDWSYGKLGDNLKDHALAIKQLGERFSWIDTENVGIFGHSAGGYDAAHALMTLNDTYKAAVSQAADHDWRMEKAWWPEMYAGWPVGDYYDAQSNITLAPKLKGELLLIHGGIDENVNPSATFKLSEALIKADKYFDLLIVPSGRHGLPKNYEIYLAKKRWNFFAKHLISK